MLYEFPDAGGPHRIQHLVNQQMLKKFGQDTKKIDEANQRDEIVFSRKWYESGRLNILYKKIKGQLSHQGVKDPGR